MTWLLASPGIESEKGTISKELVSSCVGACMRVWASEPASRAQRKHRLATCVHINHRKNYLTNVKFSLLSKCHVANTPVFILCTIVGQHRSKWSIINSAFWQYIWKCNGIIATVIAFSFNYRYTRIFNYWKFKNNCQKQSPLLHRRWCFRMLISVDFMILRRFGMHHKLHYGEPGQRSSEVTLRECRELRLQQ